MAEHVEIAVIGAGVIGLAVARQLAIAGHDVILLERESTFGTGTSARNSEVLHAGMYYATDSLKARLCVQGNPMLQRYLRDRAIPHHMVGKLIVACEPAELPKLEAIWQQGQRNGVSDLRLEDAAYARRLEPALSCVAAIHSPVTGIFDSHAYMLSLLADFEEARGIFVPESPVLGGSVRGHRLVLSVGGRDPTQLSCQTVINAAGLGAQTFATHLDGMRTEHIPPLHFCKGNYFLLNGRPPFQRLIYPLPDLASIGLHYTLDLAGQGRFGPDVEWTTDLDYTVDPTRAASFATAIRRYWPTLPDDALRPGYAGIRPKIQEPGAPPQDFAIVGPERHAIPGLYHLFGIESPGLTASLAIGHHLTELLQ